MARNNEINGENRSLYRVSVPYPNPWISEWLKSPKAYDLVERYTAEVFAIYEANLPIRRSRLGRQPPPGNLKRSAYYRVDRAGWGAEKDRWMGHVGNFAPYSRVIEYGSARRNIAGQHTLRAAGLAVFGHATADGVFSNVKPETAKLLDRGDSQAKRKLREGRRIHQRDLARQEKGARDAARREVDALHRAQQRARKNLKTYLKEERKFYKSPEGRQEKFRKDRAEFLRRKAAGEISDKKGGVQEDATRKRTNKDGTPRKIRSDKGFKRGQYKPRDPEKKASARLPQKQRSKQAQKAADIFNKRVDEANARLQSFEDTPRLRYEQLIAKEDAGEVLSKRESAFIDKYLDSL